LSGLGLPFTLAARLPRTVAIRATFMAIEVFVGPVAGCVKVKGWITRAAEKREKDRK